MNGEEKREKTLLASAKADESIAFFNSFMPPIEVWLLDGTHLPVKYSELDERLEELKQARRRRGKHHV